MCFRDRMRELLVVATSGVDVGADADVDAAVGEPVVSFRFASR